MDSETLKKEIDQLEFTIENYEKFEVLHFLKNRMPPKHHLQQDLEFKKRDLDNIKDSEEVEKRLLNDFKKLPADEALEYLYKEILVAKEMANDAKTSACS